MLPLRTPVDVLNGVPITFPDVLKGGFVHGMWRHDRRLLINPAHDFEEQHLAFVQREVLDYVVSELVSPIPAKIFRLGFSWYVWYNTCMEVV